MNAEVAKFQMLEWRPINKSQHLKSELGKMFCFLADIVTIVAFTCLNHTACVDMASFGGLPCIFDLWRKARPLAQVFSCLWLACVYLVGCHIIATGFNRLASFCDQLESLNPAIPFQFVLDAKNFISHNAWRLFVQLLLNINLAFWNRLCLVIVGVLELAFSFMVVFWKWVWIEIHYFVPLIAKSMWSSSCITEV